MIRLRTKLLIERIVTITIIMILIVVLFLKYSNEQDQKISEINAEISDEYIKVAENVIPAVVAISTLAGESKNYGSGAIVNKDGYILTNAHVVTNGTNISVTLPDKRIFSAKIIGVDAATDVAVIKINGKNLPIAELGDSEKIKVGEKIVAIGNPFGFDSSITTGIISAKNRNRGPTIYKDFIQIDAPINFGNSGGPLVNLDGEVIGINTFVVGSNIGSLGFAVPINLAKKVMEELIKNGKVERGFLGVNVIDVVKLDEQGNGEIEDGAKVISLFKDGPAEKVGIIVNDTITYIDGIKIEDSNHLKNLLAWIPKGTEVEIKLQRTENGKVSQKTIKVNLAIRPDDTN